MYNLNMKSGKTSGLFAWFGRSEADGKGWLKISAGARLYEIVGSIGEATAIRVAKKKGKGTKDDWTKFFNSEAELEGWTFRPVGTLRKP